MFHRNHKSITNSKFSLKIKHMNLQNCSYITPMRGMDMHVLSIYIPFVCSFVCSFMCLPGTQRGDENPTAIAQTHKRCVWVDWVVGEETSPIPQKQCTCTEELFGGPLLKMWRKKPLSSSKSNHVGTITWILYDLLARNSLRIHVPKIAIVWRNVTFSKPGMLRVHDSFAVAFYLTFEVKCPPCEPQTSTLPATNIFAPENG